MKIEIEELSSIERRVSFEIPSETVEQLLSETYRQIGKQARIKGFRKGRIPRHVLAQYPHYRDAVLEEVQRRLEQSAYEEMFDHHISEVLAISNREDGVIKSGQPYIFSTTVETAPSLELSGAKELELNFEIIEVEESDIDVVLERKRESKATLEPLSRSAQEGDILKLECKDLAADGPAAEARPFEFELGVGPFPALVQEQLAGLETGQEKEIEVPDLEDDKEADDKTPLHRYHFKIEGVYKRVVPELDDEFAKDEDFDDLAAMKADIRKELEERESTLSQQRAEEQMMKLLVEKFEVPVPPGLLEKHIDTKVNNLLMQLRMYTGGQDMPFSGDAFRENMRADAKKDIQHEFILKQVIEDNDITIEENEIDEKLGELAKQKGHSLAYVKSQYGKDEKESLGRQIQREKARKHLLSITNRNDETLTKTERETRIQEEREKEKAEIQSAQATEANHDHSHDHNCEHDHDHS